jgi:ATP-dependent metalloprotease FtsH
MRTSFILLCLIRLVSSFFENKRNMFTMKSNLFRKYPISKYQREHLIKQMENITNDDSTISQIENIIGNNNRKYPISRYEKEYLLKRLNSKNTTIRDEEMLGLHQNGYEELFNNQSLPFPVVGGIRIIINRNEGLNPFSNADPLDDDDLFERRRGISDTKDTKSENFEVIKKSPYNFTNIGGYDNIKMELNQCIDIIKNHTKYAKYNVRVPRGIIFEGPPGNGKTLLAKAFAGESKTSFIAVSGSEFQEKYVGVGSSRIRELFKLAKKNVPCIVFIDEIDALGRKRSGDGESSSSERDSTLNELLVALDGFKNTSGIFIIGATNRVDLLDPALIRPGRVDKRIYIGLPDSKTREAILNIHLKGKTYDSKTIIIQDLVELTTGLSGAQIENLVNEAMLNALRNDREIFTIEDIDSVMNKMMVGWQPNEHEFTSNVIDSIAIHEMGHAVVGMLSKHHSKMSKVIINLSSPKTPAYTVFEAATSSIFTREALFEHLMILLAGRIAEEVFFDVSVTTGAINDFEEALKLAQQMIVYYGMGKQVIYPSMSDKYKEMIDSEVATLLHSAYEYAEFIIRNSKDLIQEGAELLKRDKLLKAETILGLLNDKYRHVLSLKMNE